MTTDQQRTDDTEELIYMMYLAAIGFTPGGRSTVHINPLKPELNPICYLLALLEAHHFLHVSRIRVKLLTLR